MNTSIFRQINWRQPKYMIPAIVYIPLLFTGYFIIDMFHTDKLETVDTSLKTTHDINAEMPGAKIKDGRPYVCFAMNVVISAKTGINKTVEVSVIKDGTLTEVGNPPVGSCIEVAGILTLKKRGDNLYFNLSATGINPDTTTTEDSITGQTEFRGKTGKQIEEKTDKKGKPFLSFSAFSAEKVQDGFEYIWVRFIRFDHEREAWVQPGTKISVKGELDVSVYNDRLNFSCKVSEISEYIPQPYNP